MFQSFSKVNWSEHQSYHYFHEPSTRHQHSIQHCNFKYFVNVHYFLPISTRCNKEPWTWPVNPEHQNITTFFTTFLPSKQSTLPTAKVSVKNNSNQTKTNSPTSEAWRVMTIPMSPISSMRIMPLVRWKGPWRDFMRVMFKMTRCIIICIRYGYVMYCMNTHIAHVTHYVLSIGFKYERVWVYHEAMIYLDRPELLVLELLMASLETNGFSRGCWPCRIPAPWRQWLEKRRQNDERS